VGGVDHFIADISSRLSILIGGLGSLQSILYYSEWAMQLHLEKHWLILGRYWNVHFFTRQGSGVSKSMM